MSVTLTPLPKEVNDEVVRLRDLLQKNNWALGAIFIASTNGETVSLIFAEDMSTEGKVGMLRALEDMARETKKLHQPFEGLPN